MPPGLNLWGLLYSCPQSLQLGLGPGDKLTVVTHSDIIHFEK